MGLVVFGTIFAVIGILVAIFGRHTSISTFTTPSGNRVQISYTTVGGILIALLGAGLVIGGLVETLSK